MRNMKKSVIADMSLLFVAIVWGGGFIAVKGALDNVTPFYMMAMRFGIATILMSIIFFKKLKHITVNDIKYGGLVGTFLFLGFATQTVGMKYTTAGKNAFLTGTNVVIVPFLYWVISKKRPDIYSIFGAVLSLMGIGLLTLNGSFSIGYGDKLTLMCAVFFACHIVFVGFYIEKTDALVLTIVQMGMGFILSLGAALLFEPAMPPLTSKSIIAVGYLAIFSTMIAFIIQNVAQKYTSSTHAAIILCMESVFGCLLSVLVLNEEFTIKMILGCTIIFLAIITAETKWSFLRKQPNKLSVDSEQIITDRDIC